MIYTYDAGLLSDYGGGNVEWWQDYIRAELGRSHDFYSAQLAEKDAEIARLRAMTEDDAQRIEDAVATARYVGNQLAAATKRLEDCEAAIAEYYRYQTGGETRGSYDGKPERNGLWKAMYGARAFLASNPTPEDAALSAASAGRGG